MAEQGNPPPDLCATVLTLIPVEAGTMPLSQGRAAHALLLHLVQGADPDLAARIHDASQLRPFTCSSLWKADGPAASAVQRTADGGRLRMASVSPGEAWHLRYTTLNAELTRAWVERVLPALPEEVAFGGVPFRLLGSAAQADEHPWAGCDTYAGLASPHLLGQETPIRRWRFSFAAPTAFQSGGMAVPIPLPDLVFGSLLDRWNAWSPVALNPEVRRFARECVAVSNYALRTRAIPGKPGQVQRGAVGRCDYTALNGDRYWCATLSVLAAFAFYGSVGRGTAQGMGMVRWLGS